VAKKNAGKKIPKKSSIPITNEDLLNAVKSVYTRVDETHGRIDDVNTRMDGVNIRIDDVNTRMDDIQTHLNDKICELTSEVTRQFTNHLSDHKQMAIDTKVAAERKRIRKMNVLKCGLRIVSIVLGSGGITGLIFYIVSLF